MTRRQPFWKRRRRKRIVNTFEIRGFPWNESPVRSASIVKQFDRWPKKNLGSNCTNFKKLSYLRVRKSACGSKITHEKLFMVEQKLNHQNDSVDSPKSPKIPRKFAVCHNLERDLHQRQNHSCLRININQEVYRFWIVWYFFLPSSSSGNNNERFINIQRWFTRSTAYGQFWRPVKSH